MAYTLKSIRYQGNDRHILLQNENGPCPLLAAANALLLRGICVLPSAAVRNGVASLDNVANMLAEQAMTSSDHEHAIFVDELMQYIPKFQYGMDVNPSFTKGVTGYEYTAQLTAFDMLRCQLVHGWLVDAADEETFKAIGSRTYNQVVEQIILGQEASAEIESLASRIREMKEDPERSTDLLEELETKAEALNKTIHDSMLMQQFLESTGHQLTHYGLYQLHESLKINELCVFFRNNHFGTLTKHEDGHLYLLVTDLGYSNSPAVVWEKLDMIDGDTEYVNHDFKVAGSQDQILPTGPSLSPEQMLAASSQNDADYQLALQLSGQAPPDGRTAQQRLDEQEGKIMAAATEASLRDYHGMQETQTPETPTPTAAMKEDQSYSGKIYPASDQDFMITDAGTQVDADHMMAMQLQEDNQTSFENESLQLAKRLQDEEDQRSAQRRQPPVGAVSRREAASTASGCLIS